MYVFVYVPRAINELIAVSMAPQTGGLLLLKCMMQLPYNVYTTCMYVIQEYMSTLGKQSS